MPDKDNKSTEEKSEQEKKKAAKVPAKVARKLELLNTLIPYINTELKETFTYQKDTKSFFLKLKPDLAPRMSQLFDDFGISREEDNQQKLVTKSFEDCGTLQKEKIQENHFTFFKIKQEALQWFTEDTALDMALNLTSST